jgi:hypothetical protein
VKHYIFKLYRFAVPNTDKENGYRTQMVRLSNDGEHFSVIPTNLIQSFLSLALCNDLQYSPFLDALLR